MLILSSRFPTAYSNEISFRHHAFCFYKSNMMNRRLGAGTTKLNFITMKKLFLCLSMLGMLLTGCSKDDDNETPGLPPLPDPDDVCSCMDDLVFMQYCYENFDVNKDGKVSKTEANAVTKIDLTNADVKTLTGICYFPNLEIIDCYDCNRLVSVDLSHNLKITVIQYHAFAYCYDLKSIIFPNSVTSIREYVFSSSGNLERIYCASINPPGLESYIPSSSTIYVPMKSVDAYKQANGWKEYADQIVGYDF